MSTTEWTAVFFKKGERSYKNTCWNFYEMQYADDCALLAHSPEEFQ